MAKKISTATGLDLWGYARGGFYGAAGSQPKAGYQLGGDLQHYRLGNEGDNYIEFGLGRKFDLGEGLKWGVYYMPKVYNGTSGTAQVYSDISGLEFAPNLSFWAGQRFHRIQDVHILDNWVMEDGDNYGAGVDGIAVGGGKLNLSVYSDGNSDNHNTSSNNGKRMNFQLVDLPVNPGGLLSLTGGVIGGSYALGKKGGALGLLHNQKDFLVKGLTNSLFLQASNGHAALNGKFYNLDDVNGVAQAGAKQARIIEAINWQVGKFGGQALVGYQTRTPDSGPSDGVKTKDLSVGGRVSYGVARQVKLLGEVGLTSRAIDGQDKQRLYKSTAAVAFSPNTDFWTRPEFRVYLTRANWNDAAATANSSSFGTNGRKSATSFGVQMEVWWQ
ncbi:maltoporin [Rhodoferax koreense]|uniref:Maltoporin n=1 Tax=Rhodoferax koreensis TaxID=1842727 RepID=A0A1P8K3E9_9BURK|nr:maltoporin [Rhodoferax koreense]